MNGPSSNEARSAEVDPEDSQERLRAVLSAARAGILLSDPQLAAWAKALGRSDWSPIRSGEALLRLFGPALEACCPVILSALPEPGLRRRSAWVFSRLFPERTTELVLPLIFAAGAEERRTGQTIAWRAPRQVLELAPLIARGGLQSPRSAPAMREALRPNGGLSESSEFVSPALSRMAGEVRRCAPSSWRSALEDPERRIAALRLLSQWRRGRRSLLSMLLALINQRLGEPYFEYQDWAIGALAELAEPSRLLSDFAEILKAGDENSKIEVLSLLSQSEFDISSLIPAMLSALRQGSESVRRLALEALTSGRLSPALASEALATTREDPRLWPQAAYSLRRSGTPEAWATLEGALGHQSPGVRIEAIEALSRFPNQPQRAIPALLELAKRDPSVEVRAAAELALRRLGRRRGLSGLGFEILSQFQRDDREGR